MNRYQQKFVKVHRSEPGNCDNCGKDFRNVDLGPDGRAFQFWRYEEHSACSKKCLVACIGEEQAEWNRLLASEGL